MMSGDGLPRFFFSGSLSTSDSELSSESPWLLLLRVFRFDDLLELLFSRFTEVFCAPRLEADVVGKNGDQEPSSWNWTSEHEPGALSKISLNRPSTNRSGKKRDCYTTVLKFENEKQTFEERWFIADWTHPQLRERKLGLLFWKQYG